VLRRVVKSGIAIGMQWSGASLVKRTLDIRPTEPWVVGYHRVVEDFARDARNSIAATLISRAMLQHHLDWMERRFEFVSLDEVASDRRRGGTARRPSAAVTFDDGYGDVYELAFPLLKARGIPAAVFVVTALIGTSQIPLYDRLYLALIRGWEEWPSPASELARIVSALELQIAGLHGPAAAAPEPLRVLRLLLESQPQAELERLVAALESVVGVDEELLRERRPLTWDMLGTLQRAGITIGSHSRTHPLLTQESDQVVVRETLGSKRELEQRLGTDVRHFAYPNGWFNATTIKVVEEAGYRGAFTSCRHRDPAHPNHTLSRTLLWERSCLGAFGSFSAAVMGCQADGILDRGAACPLDHGN
jgi:peptidoglycan/xylan/chitin deacetylase (PgdA/CDA1 family)